MANAKGLRHGLLSTGRINVLLPTTHRAVVPVNGVAAAGTLTIAEPVSNNDTMTIGTTVYTFKTGATAAAGQIGLGASEAATKLAIVAAINGTDTFNTAHPLVSAAAWPSGDTCVLTARVKGIAGNNIATTETFTHNSNVFDAVKLGTTTEGVDGTVGVAGEQILADAAIYICLADNTIADANWRKITVAAL